MFFRLEYLSKNVAMSMVSVSISKFVSYDGPKQDSWSPWRSVKEALGSLGKIKTEFRHPIFRNA